MKTFQNILICVLFKHTVPRSIVLNGYNPVLTTASTRWIYRWRDRNEETYINRNYSKRNDCWRNTRKVKGTLLWCLLVKGMQCGKGASYWLIHWMENPSSHWQLLWLQWKFAWKTFWVLVTYSLALNHRWFFPLDNMRVLQ